MECSDISQLICSYYTDYLMLTLTLTLILLKLHQPETTATFGSTHRLCHYMFTFTFTLIYFKQANTVTFT